MTNTQRPTLPRLSSARPPAVETLPVDAPITLAVAEYGPRQRFAVTSRDGWLRLRREVFDPWSGRWVTRRAGITFSPQQTRALATAIVAAGRELVSMGLIEPSAKPLPAPPTCPACGAAFQRRRKDQRSCGRPACRKALSRGASVTACHVSTTPSVTIDDGGPA